MSGDTAFLLGATITDATLVSCSAAEPDTTRTMPDGTVGEVLFNAATNYAVGAYVYSSVTHRVYKNAAGGVNAAQPHTAPTRWIDAGPTNRWAWADWYRSTATTVTSGSLSIVVRPGSISDVVLFGLEGVVSVRVEVLDAPGGNLIFDRTYSLLYWPSGESPWITYYFDLPQVRQQFEVNGIQPANASQVTLTLTGTSGQPLSVAAVLFGRYQALGCAEFGASARQRPFSKLEEDDFGNVKILRRGFTSDIRAVAYMDTSEANAIKRAVDNVSDVPVALRISRDARYDFLRGFGLLVSEVEALAPNDARTSLELKGFK